MNCYNILGFQRTTSAAPNKVKEMVEDVEAFVDNTQMQISSVTTSSVQIVIEAIRRDLEDVEELLGKPLQRSLDDEIGIETAIRELTGLSSVTAELSSRVSALIKDCNDARIAEKNIKESLMKLSELLSTTRQDCLPRDQPLCDTVQTQSFNVLLQVDQILVDRKLKKLIDIGSGKSFNETIITVQRSYEGLPKRVSLETAASRTEIRSILNKHRNELYDSIHIFENTMNSLKDRIRGYNGTIYNVLQNVAIKDFWRWIIILGLSLLTFFVWGSLICGAPCGCDPTPKTTLFLRTGLGLTCTLSLIMWIFGAVSFLIGSHCHILVCQPLYEDPFYLTLNDLLNTKDIISQKEGDFFTYLYKENGSIRIDNILSKCKHNQTAFTAFFMHNVLNIDDLINSYQWRDLQEVLKKFPTILNNFEILSPTLSQNLQEMSLLSTVNFTTYRFNISQPLINRDLDALSDQLSSVAVQLTSSKTARSMENLAKEVQLLADTEYKNLKYRRDEIIYQMAAAEVSTILFSKQVVRCLSHLRNIQDFIYNEGVEIAKKVDYTHYFNRNLQNMHEFVMKKVNDDIGNCRPLWDMFESARTLLCKMMIDPMNGFSFACFSCILLFLGLAPVVIQTVAEYKDDEDSLDSNTHR
ncbi:hypothetical protein FQA39_LY05257 [Lamprigera yunnana]|nr:hypothetical protein FQA39_LY05257 [Lamprigera yunnana]